MASIQISDHLQSELEQIVAQSKEFADVSAYASYILEQVVAKKKQSTASGATPAASYSKEDEDKIRERLKNLGYLD